MHEEIEALRTRIEAVARGSDGRRAFTAAIRKDAVEVAARWKNAGRRMAALTDALGLHKTTLRSWTDGPKRKPRPKSRPKSSRVRAVRVESARGKQEPEKRAIRQLVATLPSGIRIEGLMIADVIELAGALR